METAGADEIPEEAERRGLGTPATRAATIEKLDALVKDTAAKVTPEKPNAKSKAKKGPEL